MGDLLLITVLGGLEASGLRVFSKSFEPLGSGSSQPRRGVSLAGCGVTLNPKP